jgi:hypothetical protein
MCFFETGIDPPGRQVDPKMMPWEEYRRSLTDEELRAMHAYLRTMQPVQPPAQ